ncbi:MAG TPA: undecaprenyl-diphosphate phosphatase [Candidatus Limnocylindrales bacterium]
METILQALVIGIVQGLTEFLPISSSAHLILLPKFLGWDDPFLNSAAFDVMLHLGTLAGMVFVLWPDLVRIVKGGVASIRDRSIGDDPDRRLAWLLLVSVVPAAILGAGLESFFDTFFRERPLAIAALVLIGAGALWLGERQGRRVRTLRDLRLRDAIVVGGAQALALFPGISRSGITIAAGLYLGLERPAAARFGFLIGVPVIAGAGIWKLRSLAGGTLDFQPLVLVAGVLGSAVAGFLAVTFVLRYLQDHSTAVFIAYRVVLAAVIVIWVLTV